MLPTTPITAAPAPPANPWPALLRVALLGTRQCPDALPTVPNAPTVPDREANLLLTAGALAVVQKAGFAAEPSALAAPAPALADAWPAPGPQGQAVLRQLLPEGTPYAEFARPYLQQLVARGYRLPEALLVPALAAKHFRNLLAEPGLLPALGARGRWLLAQNPAWQPLAEAAQAQADAPTPGPLPAEAAARLTQAWETGQPGPRAQLVATWHPVQPALVRGWLAEAIATEKGEVLADLLSHLGPQPDAADEALLTPLLMAKAKAVRQAVAPLLARVPGGALAERLWARAAPLLRRVSPLIGAKRLEISLPPAWDKTWLADGIEEKDLRVAGGERANVLGQLLALVPPARWVAHLGAAPAALLTLADRTEWAPTLIAGWAQAARLHHDLDWAAALVALLLTPGQRTAPTTQVAPLYRQLPPAAQMPLVLAHLDRLANRLSDYAPAALLLELLDATPAPWPTVLTARLRAFAEVHAAAAAAPNAPGLPALRGILRALPVGAAVADLPGLTAKLQQLAPSLVPFTSAQPHALQASILQALDLLRFRHEMAASLP